MSERAAGSARSITGIPAVSGINNPQIGNCGRKAIRVANRDAGGAADDLGVDHRHHPARCHHDKSERHDDAREPAPPACREPSGREDREQHQIEIEQGADGQVVHDDEQVLLARRTCHRRTDRALRGHGWSRSRAPTPSPRRTSPDPRPGPTDDEQRAHPGERQVPHDPEVIRVCRRDHRSSGDRRSPRSRPVRRGRVPCSRLAVAAAPSSGGSSAAGSPSPCGSHGLILAGHRPESVTDGALIAYRW